MGRLREIMQIKENGERDAALRQYASELGLSVRHSNEPELVDSIGTIERHDKIAMLTKVSIGIAIISIIMAGLWLGWNIYYNMCIYPPKYVLDDSSLNFNNYFIRWLKSERRVKGDNIYNNYVEFTLHFKVNNKNRGEGDISKPILVITAENSDEEYKIEPVTNYMETKKESENVASFKTIDLGRIIHVGSYGMVDEFFEYRIGRNDGDEKILEFLRNNEDKLKFKIRGHPYKDKEVTLSEDY